MPRLVLQAEQEKVAPHLLLARPKALFRLCLRLGLAATAAESIVQRQRERDGLVELLDVEHGIWAPVSRVQQHRALQPNHDDSRANDYFQHLGELPVRGLSCHILDDGPEAVFGECPDVCNTQCVFNL